MENTQNLSVIAARQVHLNDGNGKALCGATSTYHLVQTERPVTCKRCQAKAS